MESLLERDMMGDREGLRRDGVQDRSYIRSMGTAGVASALPTDTPRRERVATLAHTDLPGRGIVTRLCPSILALHVRHG